MVRERQPIATPAAYISPPLEKYIAWEIITVPFVENLRIDFLSKLGREKQEG
jgi:hypothetical protein